jgi:hypothetical protein
MKRRSDVSRYTPILEERFRALVQRFLATLPAEGWRGTIAELETALGALRQPSDPDYLRSGLTKAVLATAGAIKAAGWTVRQWRTAQARGLEFRRVGRHYDAALEAARHIETLAAGLPELIQGAKDCPEPGTLAVLRDAAETLIDLADRLAGHLLDLEEGGQR